MMIPHLTKRLIVAFGSLLLLSGCVRMTVAWAPLTPKGPPADPPILTSLADGSAIADADRWEDERDLLKDMLQREVYGYLPPSGRTSVVETRMIDPAALEGKARYQEYDIAVTPIFAEDVSAASAQFTMAVLSPTDVEGPVPVIMTETFCPRWAALPHPNATKPSGAGEAEMPGFVSYLFGRYICTPPLEMIIDAGFALAVAESTEIVPDSGDAGLAALDRLAVGYTEKDTRWGAIAAWGWVFSRMADVLAAEEAFDGERLAAYGHSRYGKAALFAGAFDERIAAVIAHQSGTGGASLNRRKVGESVAAITKSYPHWFAPSYAGFAGREEDMRSDQHHLIALMAPRPLMLGNARRDVWSDPNGAFKAARGASPVYSMLDTSGLTVDRLDRFDPEAGLSFWMRPGTHGVVEEDWPAFLAFLSAHLQAPGGR
ncbi:MAG: alpha/beta hydrolase [Pseudomonadota bacterium]